MKRKSLRLVLMLLVTLSILACAFTAFAYATEGAGVEKPERALYYNLNNGMFQLEWDAVPDCNSYRIYQNGTLFCETELNVAIVPSGSYTVRAVVGGAESAFVSFSKGSGAFTTKDTLYREYLFLREELGASTFRDTSISVTSEMTKIKETLNNRSATKEAVSEALALIPALKETVLYSERNLVPNIISYSISPDPFNNDYLKEYMLDGLSNTRFAAKRSGTTSIIVAELDLGGIYSISEVDIDEFANDGIPRSETTKIEFYVDGKWVEVLPYTTTTTLGKGSSSHFYTKVTTDSTLRASKVRVRIERLVDGYEKNLSIWDLSIFGKRFDAENVSPYLSALSMGNEIFAPNSEDVIFVKTPKSVSTLDLFPILLSPEWECLLSTENPIPLTKDITTLDATVTNGTESRTYKVVIARENDSILTGLKGTYEGGHYNGYFSGNDIQANVNKLTDGASNTSLTVWHSVPKAGNLTFKFDLGAYYAVNTFTISASATSNASMLGNIIVTGLVDGKWTEITTIDMTTGTVSGDVITTTVTLDQPVLASVLRFNCGYNPAVLTSDGTSLSGKTLYIYEISATSTETVISEPELASIHVNGATAQFKNGRYYVSVDENASLLNIHATATNVNTDIRYSPSNAIPFFGKTQTVTLTVTNPLGKSKEYKLTIDPLGTTKNVLSGVTPTFIQGEAIHSGYPLTNINDGNFDTRLACRQNIPYEVEFVLDGTYDIFSMDFYAYVHGTNTLTSDVTVRALIGNNWVDIAVCDTFTGYVLHNGKAGIGHTSFQFEARGVSAIRLYMKQNPNLPNNGVSVWEVDIQGAPSQSTPSNVLLNVAPSFIIPVALHDGYPLSALTDGNTATRLAARSTAPYEIEFDLDGLYNIDSFMLYTYTHGGVANTGTVTVRGLVDGEWFDLAVLDMRSDFINTVSNTAYKIVHFGARDVSAIRIHVTHNEALGKGASIWEVLAYGTKTAEEKIEKDPFKEFQIYQSVTIHNSFDINVFVPAIEGIRSLNFAGKTYEPSAMTPMRIGGASYFKLTLPIDAKHGHESYPLVITLSTEEGEFSKTFGVSLVNYLTSLAGSTKLASEKALALDTIAYVRAAVAYFGRDLDLDDSGYADYESALISLSRILDRYDYEEKTSASLGNPGEAPTTGLGIARVAFSLDSTVSFVLEPEEGYTLDDFTFRVGGGSANVTMENGYILVSVNAYRIHDTLTWTTVDKDDTSITLKGEFSLSTYYASSTVQESGSLSRLVECLAVFSESADYYLDTLPVTLTVRYESEDGTLLGSETLTRAGGSEYTVYPPSYNGYYTRDLCLKGTMKNNSTITVTYKEIPKNADPNVIATLLPGVACWGDSLTAGSGSGNVTVANQQGLDLIALGSTATGANYPTVLQNLIARYVGTEVAVANCGVGGETSAVISARAMTKTYYLTVGQTVIVAPRGSAVVDIQQYSSTGRLGILRQGKSDLINEVTIEGKDADGNPVTVTGNITLAMRQGATDSIYTCAYSDLVYTFTRTDNGATDVTLTSGTKIVTRCSYAYDGDWCVIFMGQNGGYSSFDELIMQQREILEACGSTEKFIIVGLSSGTASDRADMEEALRSYWGDHYFSARAYLSSSEALAFAGFSEEMISSVKGEIEQGKISTILLNDNTHLNAVGYALLGNAVFERMVELGYFNPVFDYYDSLK